MDEVETEKLKEAIPVSSNDAAKESEETTSPAEHYEKIIDGLSKSVITCKKSKTGFINWPSIILQTKKESQASKR